MKRVQISELIPIISENLNMGKSFELPVAGDSMLPFLVQGRDAVILVKPEFPLKKRQIAFFYWHEKNTYILHRVIKIKQDKNGEYTYTFRGDNCKAIEENVKESEIVAVVSGTKKLKTSEEKKAERQLKTEKSFSALIRLIGAAINGEQTKSLPPTCDTEEIFHIAKSHTVVTLLYHGLNQSESRNLFRDATLRQISDIRHTVIMNDLRREFEIEKILNVFEGNKVYNLLHKGYFIKNDYPAPDMRTMGDIDILIKPKQADKADKLLKSLGYAVQTSGTRGRSYQKDDFLYLEVHMYLTDTEDENFEYFNSVWDKAEQYKEYNFAKRLPAWLEYIYIIQHLKQHFLASGLGLKMLLDVYVFDKKKPGIVNSEQTTETLKTLGLKTLEEKMRSLCDIWFSGRDGDITFDNVGRFILKSCTYGDHEAAVNMLTLKDIAKNRKKEKPPSRMKYLMRRIFPSVSKLSGSYHILKKLPFLYPFLIIYYWFKRIFIRRNITRESIARHMEYTSSSSIEDYKRVLKEIGIEI